MKETVQDIINVIDTTGPVGDLTNEGFEQQFENEYAVVLINEQLKSVACILKADYIPITNFRITFNNIGELVKAGDYTKFIFDKRSLRTFHQPSMEWYYINWKSELVSFGLVNHRKILPDLPWFKKAVEIAKRPLLDKMPKEIETQLDIQYCEELSEAVRV